MQRSTRDRWIFGVCGGIAHGLGWSPAPIRLATVLLAVFIPGTSAIPAVAIYVALGLILPASEDL